MQQPLRNFGRVPQLRAQHVRVEVRHVAVLTAEPRVDSFHFLGGRLAVVSIGKERQRPDRAAFAGCFQETGCCDHRSTIAPECVRAGMISQVTWSSAPAKTFQRLWKIAWRGCCVASLQLAMSKTPCATDAPEKSTMTKTPHQSLYELTFRPLASGGGSTKSHAAHAKADNRPAPFIDRPMPAWRRNIVAEATRRRRCHSR